MLDKIKHMGKVPYGQPFYTARMMALGICALLGLGSILVLAESDTSLLWGPYRPNLYLGLRPRIPNSLLLGLMWAGVRDDVLGGIPSKRVAISS
jgi:hypothetical protein